MGYVPDYNVASQVITKVRDKFIANLRRILSTNTKYLYAELPNGDYDFSTLKVVVSDVFPQSHIWYPAVIVESVNEDETRYIGPDSNQLVKNSHNVVTDDLLFTSMDGTVTINIYTIDDSLSRDEITDLVYHLFKYTNDDLATAGIEIKQTHFPAFSSAAAGGRNYFTGKIVIDVYSEWNGTLGTGTTLSQVNTTITLSE